MSSEGNVHILHDLRALRVAAGSATRVPCSTTAPGHAVGLTGVKRALALTRDLHRAPVDARVSGVTGEHVVLALAGGPLVARTHAAGRLAELVAAAEAGERLVGRFTAHEHQLLVDVDPEASDGGTVFLAPSRPTGAVAAFNLALPWHAWEPCAVASRASREAGRAAAGAQSGAASGVRAADG